jgi:DNA gyrase subunit A
MRKDRFAIIVDEIPYQVNKSTMVERIAEAARDKRIEGIAHVAGRIRPRRRARRDRAEARRDARGGAEPALPLHADADLFGCNMLALNGGRPEQLTCATS